MQLRTSGLLTSVLDFKCFCLKKKKNQSHLHTSSPTLVFSYFPWRFQLPSFTSLRVISSYSYVPRRILIMSLDPRAPHLQTATALTKWQIKSLLSHRKKKAVLRIRSELMQLYLPERWNMRGQGIKISLTTTPLQPPITNSTFLTIFFV